MNVFSSLFVILLMINNLCYAQNDTFIYNNQKYWDSSRTYQYQAIYKDSFGQIKSIEKITIKPTSTIWTYDVKQTLVYIFLDFNEQDSQKLAINPLNGKNKKWVRLYQEGVIENSDKIWMHPIRQNQYILTEIAPFPELKFPVFLNSNWESTLYIYKAFGSFEGTVFSKYKISNVIQKKYNFGEVKCWEISSEGIHNKLGTNRATYYFNEMYGFTEMNYTFFNKESIEIILEDIKM